MGKSCGCRDANGQLWTKAFRTAASGGGSAKDATLQCCREICLSATQGGGSEGRILVGGVKGSFRSTRGQARAGSQRNP